MDTTEIAVIGAGPAGVSAAVAAARAGAKVVVIDEGARAGGQFFRQPASPPNGATPETLRQHFTRGRELLDGLSHPNITIRSETVVWNITPKRQLFLNRADGPPKLQANRVILATGATERVAAFPGWALPGVMTVGATQSLFKSQGLIPAGRVVLAGSGPLLLAAARQLVEAGAKVVGVFEATRFSRWLRRAARFQNHRDRALEGFDHWQRLRAAGVPFQFGRAVTRAEGDNVETQHAASTASVRRAAVSRVSEEWRPVPGTEKTVEADVVCVSFGFIPATELARLAGCAHRFDPLVGAFVTETNETLETSLAGIFAAGEVRGIGGAEAALAEGHIAGLGAARSLGYKVSEAELAEARAPQSRHRAFAAALADLFAVQPGLSDFADDGTTVCRCEEVTAGELREAARSGAITLNALKAWNRCGMGLCQGRMCAPIAAQIVAAEIGVSPASVGVFTARPPIKPVPLGIVGIVEDPRPTGPAMEDHVGYGRAVIR
ncbi:MAG: FAD-dependent oxidoreductase [Chloroflexi bacterium]|nr:FAD-dependent oxidoreductase [Chloroflexota bacterium]